MNNVRFKSVLGCLNLAISGKSLNNMKADMVAKLIIDFVEGLEIFFLEDPGAKKRLCAPPADKHLMDFVSAATGAGLSATALVTGEAKTGDVKTVRHRYTHGLHLTPLGLNPSGLRQFPYCPDCRHDLMGEVIDSLTLRAENAAIDNANSLTKANFESRGVGKGGKKVRHCPAPTPQKTQII